MDTPEKPPTRSPMPDFEESPFSNFINSLSPIKPSKTIRVSHSFGSLNFASPPSVFTSPQINLQRESRFLKRDQLPELAKPESSSDNENKDVCNSNEVDTLESSKDESCLEEPCEPSDLALELPKELKYDCGNSNFQAASSSGCAMNSEPESSRTQMGSAETVKNMEISRSDWANMMFDAPEHLVFESPQGQRALKELQEKSGKENMDIFTTLLSHFAEENATDVDEFRPLNSDALLQNEDQAQHDSSSNGTFTGQTNLILENKPGIRRRCLVFEIPGAKKSINDGSILTSTSSQDNMQGCDNPMGMRPGIGLHLNSLAVASMGHLILRPDNLSSPAPVSLHDENEAQFAEDASAYGVLEELNPSSPKKKRRRPENNGDSEPSCKRCNCKKSKCLKLYCECFAAGVYCVEPCACQDCFNKPIHEETVLATRKQIESRNPLAFAPKVIRNNDSVNEFVDDSNRTPASARHKRGCNCKKSNCLKKYCECYQGGVGCSIGCRCEGCKNTFGRKDGSMETEMEVDVEEDNISGDNTLAQHEINQDEEFNPVPVLPKTPLRLFRSPMPIPSASKGKPPRFNGITSCSLLSDNGLGRSTFLRSQHKTDRHHYNSASTEEYPPLLQNMSPNSSVKTLSPNSKRITPPNRDNLGHSPGLRSNRKLILQSIPSFPSLNPRQ